MTNKYIKNPLSKISFEAFFLIVHKHPTVRLTLRSQALFTFSTMLKMSSQVLVNLKQIILSEQCTIMLKEELLINSLQSIVTNSNVFDTGIIFFFF